MARDLTHRLTCSLPVCRTCGRTGRSKAWIRWALLSILLLVGIQVVFRVLYPSLDAMYAKKASVPPASATSAEESR